MRCDLSGIVDLWERRHIFSYHNHYNNNNNNDNNNNNNNNKTLMAVTITGRSRTSSLHCGPNVMLSVSVSSSSIFLVDIVVIVIVIVIISSISSNSSLGTSPACLKPYSETYNRLSLVYVCFKPNCHWYLCDASITPALSWFKMLWVLYVIRITKLTHNFVVHGRTNVYWHASAFHNTSVMTRRVYSNSKI